MSILHAVGLTLLPNIGGLAGLVVTKKHLKDGWYDKLDLPKCRPPSWYAGPVWGSLYTGMGYASYLILKDGVGDKRSLALGLYGSQLALNWAWSPIFFHFHNLGLATADLGLLLANIGACIYMFYPINKTAAYLMMPYFAWVAYSAVVTWNIWKKNCGKKTQ